MQPHKKAHTQLFTWYILYTFRSHFGSN